VELLRGGSHELKESKRIKQDLESGECQVVVGTHAIIQPSVQFHQLGLVIVDEEQRFGVQQKEALRNRTAGVDVLTLSATPIPRTLQLSMSGHRDISLMTSPPAGRKDVMVHVGKDDDLLIRDAIIRELNRDGQIFVVVPFIKDIPEIHVRLKKILSDASIDDITIIEANGRDEDLEARIDAFASRVNNARILIATTVIENGIDMPLVNTIFVFNAHRFGMSALYQLKGRVGRSERQAYSYFFTPHDQTTTIEAEGRLTWLRVFTALGSGYELARRDMDMRGHGTIFGSEQSGSSDIGVDLTTSILQAAIQDLQTDFVLSVPETRVMIPGKVLDYARSLGLALPALDRVEDSFQVARWEYDLTKTVSKTIFPSKSELSEALVEDLMQCQDIGDFDQLEEDLSSMLFKPPKKIPDILLELLHRWRLRRACQQVGIYQCVYIKDRKEIVFLTQQINEKKWRKLQPYVPEVCYSWIDVAWIVC
jgi:hypothetical protein